MMDINSLKNPKLAKVLTQFSQNKHVLTDDGCAIWIEENKLIVVMKDPAVALKVLGHLISGYDLTDPPASEEDELEKARHEPVPEPEPKPEPEPETILPTSARWSEREKKLLFLTRGKTVVEADALLQKLIRNDHFRANVNQVNNVCHSTWMTTENCLAFIAILVELGWSKAAIGKEIGYGEGTVSKWTTGAHGMSEESRCNLTVLARQVVAAIEEVGK